jgi:hypothetical protein
MTAYRNSRLPVRDGARLLAFSGRFAEAIADEGRILRGAASQRATCEPDAEGLCFGRMSRQAKSGLPCIPSPVMAPAMGLPETPPNSAVKVLCRLRRTPPTAGPKASSTSAYAPNLRPDGGRAQRRWSR